MAAPKTVMRGVTPPSNLDRAPTQLRKHSYCARAVDTMSVRIETITESDIDGAIECIQQAFADDPYANWVFDRAHFSKTRNHASLKTRCLWGIQHALFHVAKDPADGRVLGVAMWLPPALARPVPELSWSEYLKSYLSPASWSEWAAGQATSWSLWLAQVRMNLRHGRGGLIVRRYYIWKAAQAEAQKELWDDEKGYYFCNIVTVLPEAQGRGVGKKLMEEVLKKADDEGYTCYLESSRDEPNVQIYERMGFKLIRKMQCKDGEQDPGVMLFCMSRKPQRS